MPILIPNAPFDAPMGADEPVDAPTDASMPSPVRDTAVIGLRRLSPACAGCVSPPRVPPDMGALIKGKTPNIAMEVHQDEKCSTLTVSLLLALK